MSNKPKQSLFRVAWRWIWRLLASVLIMLVLVMTGSGLYIVSVVYEVSGFMPWETMLAKHTPKDVVGDLGGMKVKIPSHYAEYVEYDGDPGFGEKRKGQRPERTFDSRLRSFGIEARYPDMKGLENDELRAHYKENQLRPENPWIRVSINSGQDYPSMGVNANNGQAQKLWQKGRFWWNNFERAPDLDVASLEAYVVAGIDPKSGKLARHSDLTDDIYIYKTAPAHVDTYITCGRTYVEGGISRCTMGFSLEPKAKVYVEVHLYPALLPQWQSIKRAVSDLLCGFEIKAR